MPDVVAANLTEGQRAALAVVAIEYADHGFCDLPIDAIAGRAGVCRSTVQSAIRSAVRGGKIEKTERRIPGRPSLTNVIAIVDPAWLAWLSHRPKRLRQEDRALSIGQVGGGFKQPSTTKEQRFFPSVATSPAPRQWCRSGSAGGDPWPMPWEGRTSR